MAQRRHSERGTPISLFSFQDIMAAVTGVMILVTLLVALEPLAAKILESSPTDPTEAPMESIESAQALVASLREALERRLAAPTISEHDLELMERESEVLEASIAELVKRRQRVESTLERVEAERAEAERSEQNERMMMEEAVSRWQREQMRSRVRFLPGERFPKVPLFLEVARDGASLGELAPGGEVRLLSRTPSTAEGSVLHLLGERSPEAYQVVFVVRQDAIEPFVRLRDALHARGWEIGWQLWDAREGGFFDPLNEGKTSP